jgi:hypothetical protein
MLGPFWNGIVMLQLQLAFIQAIAQGEAHDDVQ